MPKKIDLGQAAEQPTVRLVAPNVAGQHQGVVTLQHKPAPAGPDIRLAVGVGPPEAFAQGLAPPASAAPDVRLAVAGTLTQDKDMALVDPATVPALLVSYYYLPQFLENRHRYCYRNWVMDSGAFSAHNSSAEINLDQYIECCHQLIAEDPTLVEIFSLDVIGDWRASHANTEKMWAAGIPAIPCYHYNEPWDVLVGLARDYPKIALGGVALAKSGKKMAWASQCFARVWPKKIHGFAFGSETAILGLPWHSTDATNWEIGPTKYGRWAAFGNAHISVRGSQQNLRAEVEYYLELEQRAQKKWAKQMAELEELSPTVRLAYSNGGGGENTPRALGAASSLRRDGTQRVGSTNTTDEQVPAPVIRLAHKESNRPNKLGSK